MKKLLYQKRKLILILIIPYLFIVTSSIIHIEYDLTAPGELNLVESVISIDSPNKQAGSFHTISVFVNERTSLLSYLLAHLHPLIGIEKSIPTINLSNQESRTSGLIQKTVSINNALIVSYQAAGKRIDYEHKGIIIHTVTKELATGLELGDIITVWGGKTVSATMTRDDFKVIKDEQYEAKLWRNNRLITVNVKPKTDKLGIYYYHYYKINSANPSYQTHDSATVGPSGGLMQALAVYNAITVEDITKGLKIAGTGTIDVFGNVGPIGGVYQKIFTAHLAKADVFFVPVEKENGEIVNREESNYSEALTAYHQIKNPKMALVPVSTLSEAIAYLEQWEKHS